jgi:hypothetical protein
MPRRRENADVAPGDLPVEEAVDPHGSNVGIAAEFERVLDLPRDISVDGAGPGPGAREGRLLARGAGELLGPAELDGVPAALGAFPSR